MGHSGNIDKSPESFVASSESGHDKIPSLLCQRVCISIITDDSCLVSVCTCLHVYMSTCLHRHMCNTTQHV